MARQNQGNTPKQPRVSLSGFAQYLSAGTSGRLNCVRKQIELYEGDYRATAFYKEFVDALVEGRRSATDELTLQRCVSRQTADARHDNYADLRRDWLAMPKLHLPYVPVGRTRWTAPGLTVTISPELGLRRPSGNVEVVKLWLYKTEPAPDAIKAMQFLLAEHIDQLCPGATPAILDLRRRKLHAPTKRPYKKGFEQLLSAEAASMAALWNSLIKTA